MSIDLKLLNAALKSAIDEVNPVHVSSDDKGAYGKTTSVYPTHDPEIFIKVVEESDSYGNDPKIIEISFTKAKVVTAIEYAPV